MSTSDLNIAHNEDKPSLRGQSLASTIGSLGWAPLSAIDEPVMSPRVQIFYKKQSHPQYRLLTYSPADLDECKVLFRKAFGEPMRPELWEWKYGGGRGLSVIARRGQELVAHYGSASRAVRYLGQTIHAVQICDVMVDPVERAILTKTGAFSAVARISQESIIGYGKQHLFGYGFPSLRHMRLGQRAGLYEEVDRMLELSWSPKQGSKSMLCMLRPVREIKTNEREINQLWAEMANDLSEQIVGIRDAAYLQYRYEYHPIYFYHLFLLKHRWTGRAMGLIVLRRDNDCCRLIDLVGPLRNISLMVDYARRITADWSMSTLQAWITKSQSEWLATPEAEVRPTEVCIPGNCYVEKVPIVDLKNRWWLMMGDTDFL